jgi:hypothetical protein
MIEEQKSSFSSPEHVYDKVKLIDDFNELIGIVHDLNFSRGWWTVNNLDMRPKKADERSNWAIRFIPYIVATKVALMHSELSEGLEAYRKDLMDDKLVNRPGLEVELVDTIIRCLDLLGAFGYNAGETLVRVLENNLVRKDHDPAVRAQQGGKKF